MGQRIAGTEGDGIVVGLIGERSREVSDFVETKLPPEVRKKAVVVAVPADHPPLLRLRAAMRATAIAEAFRHEGKTVLLLIDSLTRVAHAQREIGLTDRKSVVEGKSVSVRVDLGGRRLIKNTKRHNEDTRGEPKITM